MKFELDSSSASGQGFLVGCCEHDREFLHCMKGEEFHDQLSNYQLVWDFFIELVVWTFNLVIT